MKSILPIQQCIDIPGNWSLSINSFMGLPKPVALINLSICLINYSYLAHLKPLVSASCGDSIVIGQTAGIKLSNTVLTVA